MSARRYPLIAHFDAMQVGESIPEPHTSVDCLEAA
jgi:hypothetical protein